MKQDLYNNDWINIDGNSIHKTAIIHPNVKLGTGNTIGAFCVIGGNGEIRNVSQNDFHGTVHIGDNNVISEHVTIQRPKDKNKSTIIGNGNLIMAHVHIGHDAYIGNGCEICTSSVIGGYVTIYDEAKIKLHCVIRNRLIIGNKAIIGMGSVVTRDVNHNAVVYGNPANEKEKTIEEMKKHIEKEVLKDIVIGSFDPIVVTGGYGCLIAIASIIAGCVIAYLFM